MSQILQKSPFDPDILKHNEAQLDFILEMYANDNPKILSFTRPGKSPPGVEETTANAAWADVLTGSGYREYMASKTPSSEVLSILRGMREMTQITPMGKAPSI